MMDERMLSAVISVSFVSIYILIALSLAFLFFRGVFIRKKLLSEYGFPVNEIKILKENTLFIKILFSSFAILSLVFLMLSIQ